MDENPAASSAPEQGATPGEEMSYRLHQQELLSNFGLFALKSQTIDDLLQEATRLCAEGLNTRFSKALKWLPSENRLLVRAGVGWRPGVVGHATLGADMDSPAGYALHTGRPVLSNHLVNESRFRTPVLLAEHGVKRALNVLIRGDGEPFGVLEVDSSCEGRFTEADIAFLQGFANLLGVAIERQRRETELAEARELQQVLVQEVHHRTKNSLSIVAGLLSMQRKSNTNLEVKSALSDAEARLFAMAEAHDHLWRRADVTEVDLSEFLGALVEKLRQAWPAHDIRTDFGSILLSTDQAISLALLTNELVTNAGKHAYPGAHGAIRIIARADTDADSFELVIEDDGVGLPVADAAPHRAGMGMRVAFLLARQLRGELQVKPKSPGVRVSLRAPLGVFREAISNDRP